MLDNPRDPDRPWSDLDRKVAGILSSYRVNFAKMGNPNGPGVPSWPAYATKDEPLANIGAAVSVENVQRARLDVLAEREEQRRRAGREAP